MCFSFIKDGIIKEKGGVFKKKQDRLKRTWNYLLFCHPGWTQHGERLYVKLPECHWRSFPTTALWWGTAPAPMTWRHAARQAQCSAWRGKNLVRWELSTRRPAAASGCSHRSEGIAVAGQSRLSQCKVLLCQLHNTLGHTKRERERDMYVPWTSTKRFADVKTRLKLKAATASADRLKTVSSKYIIWAQL